MNGGVSINENIYQNPHDGARMYNFWANDLFGECACLNVIRETKLGG